MQDVCELDQLLPLQEEAPDEGSRDDEVSTMPLVILLQVESLIDDLRDGVRLLALLEVLSGERLPMERGRVLRRPHYLSNINTALEFLRGKRVSPVLTEARLEKTNIHVS